LAEKTGRTHDITFESVQKQDKDPTFFPTKRKAFGCADISAAMLPEIDSLTCGGDETER